MNKVGVKPEGFGKERRVRKRAEFQAVFQKNTKVVSSHLVVLGLARANTTGRLGLVVSKKVGSAVVRNRMKRALREIYRRPGSPGRSFREGIDLVVIARPGANKLTQDQLAEELWALVKRLRGKVARLR